MKKSSGSDDNVKAVGDANDGDVMVEIPSLLSREVKSKIEKYHHEMLTKKAERAPLVDA